MEAKTSRAAIIVRDVLVWLFFVYLYFQILRFNQGSISNPILSGMYLVQFGVHEVSHILFSFLLPILTAAAGSLSEIALASLIVVAAIKGNSRWAMVFGLLWLMMAFISMGNYMADARAQLMPLMGPSPDLVHDWHFVFGELGWLNADVVIGTTMKVIGWIIGAAALAYGLIKVIAPSRSARA